MSLFVGAFALDAIHQGAPAFLLHAAPGLVLLLIVIASWRGQWVGGVGFSMLGALYATRAWRHADWLLVISAPLLLVGLLFLWSWRQQRHLAHLRV
jgi:hypothetical protein